MLLSYSIVDFYLLYDGAVLFSLLTISQCKVSDTQVTVKACGPLVIQMCQLCPKFSKLH